MRASGMPKKLCPWYHPAVKIVSGCDICAHYQTETQIEPLLPTRPMG